MASRRKVPQTEWQGVVDALTRICATAASRDGFIAAIGLCGDKVAQANFPRTESGAATNCPTVSM